MNKLFLSILLIIPSIGFAQFSNKYIRQGNEAYDDKNYKEAETLYMKSVASKKNAEKSAFNLGNSLYKQEQFEDAKKTYEALINNKSEVNVADTWYNLGNSLMKSEKLQESIEAYKQALRNDPSHQDARYNLVLAQRMLKEQEQNQDQEQNKDQQEQEDQEDQEDQQKQDQENKEGEEQQEQQEQQQQQSQEKEQQSSEQQQQGKISKEDAERILQAMRNQEAKTLEKQNRKKQKSTTNKIDKNW